jgi:hypothetical protein
MKENFAAARIAQLERGLGAAENQLMTLSKVLREIVGKELLRSQAVQVALIKKGILADGEVVTALQELIDGAKGELKSEADKVEANRLKATEILVPTSVQANSNQDTTPTPAVVPVTEAPYPDTLHVVKNEAP